MSFLKLPVLILDCQTTGMRPSSGRILEMAMAITAAEETRFKIDSWVFKGDDVPDRIREITGIEDRDLANAWEQEKIFETWQALRQQPNSPSHAVIHYSQFERPFLEKWHAQNGQTFDLKLICSHRLAKKLFPEIPSQNLRALAGFFGGQLGELKRARSHVDATITVWKAIAEKLNEMQIHDFEALTVWMKEKPKSKTASRYQYRMDRLARLSLPNKPGIYRMLAKDGRILYVGKATSLKSRVNSYFRGQKGRDRRKLEMLAQVWDLKVTECETPLEAALLETDEIKKWDPPYNVSLKAGDRRLLFYSKDFEDMSERQSARFPIGPFRPMNVLESLREMQIWLSTGEVRPIFYQEIGEATLLAGFRLFCERQNWDEVEVSRSTLREWLILAMPQLRKFLRDHPGCEPEQIFQTQKEALRAEAGFDLGDERETEITAEDVAGKFERLLIRSALAVRRARQLTKLRNVDILIPTAKGPRRLSVRDGCLTEGHGRPKCSMPWEGADIADYDRMSVLLSEVTKHSCRVDSAVL